jgi:hypothetical protein
MLRKFPNQPGFPQQMMPVNTLDKNSKRDYFGEMLYTKISTNMQFGQIADLHSKIVGIFLDLDEPVLQRLITDEIYFTQQVVETVRVIYFLILVVERKDSVISINNFILKNIKKLKITINSIFFISFFSI